MANNKTMQLVLQDLLTNYFKQYHFNKMPENVRAKFDEYVEKDDLVGNMKDWKANLWVKDGKKDPADALKTVSTDDLVQLYKDIRSRLQELNQMRKLGKNGQLDDKHPATQFLDEYFGEGNMFHESRVDDRVKTSIKRLLDSNNYNFKMALNFGLSDVKKSEGSNTNKYTLEELKHKVTTEEYNKDPEFRKDLYSILKATYRDFEYDYTDNESRQIKFELSELINNGFDPNPSNSEIEDFRDELPAILNQVYAKKKLRDTLFANSTIANALNIAREEVDYDKSDSECFIEGKTDDQLSIMQFLKKEITDKYEDYLEKYTHGGDHLFKSREACEIMGALKKVGIKKTDGLDKILEKSEEIKAKTVSKMKKAGPHFDWTVKEFKKLKKDMPKAFNGCLNNGVQLSRMVQQLIMDAVEQDKIDEAETAMEMLIVMQYGNTTSALMEKIRGDKDLFSLFSNKELSWNKNEAISFVTGALDKTIRLGGLAVGYGLTFLYNNVRQLGGKIKEGDGNKFFKTAQDKWANNNEEKATKEAALARADKRVKKYEGGLGLDDATKARLEATGQSIEDFINEQRDTLNTEKDDIEGKFLKVDNVQKILDTIENTYLYGLIGKVPEDLINLGQGYINALREQLNDNVAVKDLPNVPGELLANPQTKRYFAPLQNTFNKEKQNQQNFSDKQEQINRFNEASAELEMAQKQYAKYQKQVNDFDASKKNKFDRLVNHWNELMENNKIFGNQRKWIGSTKAAQAAYWKKQAEQQK